METSCSADDDVEWVAKAPEIRMELTDEALANLIHSGELAKLAVGNQEED